MSAGQPPLQHSPPVEQPDLSLVIPAFNEERRLGPTLERTLGYFAGRRYRTQLIVVSDGSTDRTSQIAGEALAATPALSNVTGSVIEYRPNRGKGRAVRTGVKATHGRFVAFTDADLSTPIEEVDRALEYARGAVPGVPAYRVVIGSRAVGGAAVERRQPLYRRLGARFFNVVRDAVAGIRDLHDTQCGLKLFDGELARFVFGRQRIDGFMFDVETLYIVQRLGVDILELGVRWADDPDSKVRLRSGFRMIPDLLRIRLLHRSVTPADLPAHRPAPAAPLPA